MTKRAVLRCRLFAFLSLLPLLTLQGVSQVNETPKAVQSNVEILQFVSNKTLSPQEREQVVQEVKFSMSKASRNVAKRDDLIAQTLANAAKYPKDAPRLRELWRYDIAANVPHDDIEYKIAERYDPTVVMDRAHQRIVTGESLVALRACTEWLVNNLHKPPPGSTFIASEKNYIRASYSSFSDDVQDAYAHVARNYPRAVDLFDGVVAAQRDHFFAENAKAVKDSNAAVLDAALISRIAYNMAMRRAGGRAGTEGRVFDYMVQQSLLNQQLQRAIIKNPPLPPPN
jgi:hypothetical protein